MPLHSYQIWQQPANKQTPQRSCHPFSNKMMNLNSKQLFISLMVSLLPVQIFISTDPIKGMLLTNTTQTGL